MTAKEFLENHSDLSIYSVQEYDEGGYIGVNELNLYNIMIEFAKLHVQAALESAAKNAEISCGPPCCVDTESILNAYPLDQIK